MGVERWERKTVGSCIKSTDGHVRINVGKQQASWPTDSSYSCKLIELASISEITSGKAAVYVSTPVHAAASGDAPEGQCTMEDEQS